MTALALQLAQIALVVALAPVLTGIVRTIKARLLRRRGPSPLQPWRDLLRLFRKETVVAENASWLFLAAPYVVFATTLVAAVIVPTFAIDLPLSATADLIAIVALLGTARFFLALAGLDIGTSFGGIGASREVMFASFAEPAMIMIVFTLALVADSTQIPTIATVLISGEVGLRVSLALALIALLLVSVAENGRIPVDNPATHLELTMVHEAMILEYSGRHLALIELAASLKLLLYLSVISVVAFPWSLVAISDSPTMLALGLAVYPIKLSIGALLLALFETSIAKLRVFRVPDFLGVALMLGFLGALLLLVTRTF